MSTKINHDIRSNNGQTIYLPPEMAGASGQGNLALPNVFSESVSAGYPIGTRFVNGDRTYHYYYAGGTISYTLAAISNRGAFLKSWANSYDSSQPAGTNPYKMDGTSAGVPAANALAGGYLLVYVATAIGRFNMRVVSNTAAATASPYTTELTLEQATPVVVAANTGSEVYANPYANLQSSWGDSLAGDYCYFAGLPAINMTSTYWGWVLTWGPCFIVATSTATGGATYARTLIFNADGSVAPASERWGAATSLAAQFAGVALNLTTSGSGDQWMRLMLDP